MSEGRSEAADIINKLTVKYLNNNLDRIRDHNLRQLCLAVNLK